MKASIAMALALLTVAMLSATPRARAAPGGWSDGSAQTMAPGRLELGLLTPSRWAIDERVELGAHPIWLFALPHVEAKVRWWQDHVERPTERGRGPDAPPKTPRFVLSSKHRLSVPTPFLHLIAGEGAGALLPADAEVPLAVELQNDVLASWLVARQALTARVGLVVSAREQSDLPLLDFPFLYQRFASLYAPIVPRAGLGANGNLAWRLDYETGVLASYLPIEDKYFVTSAWAFDGTARLHVRIAERHRMTASVLATVAEFPIGWRFYWMPTVDYRFVLFE